MAAVGAWSILCVLHWRRGAWPVPWALYGRYGSVAGPLGPVWPPWWRGRSPGPRMDAGGRGLSPGSFLASVGSRPVPWATYGRRGGVADPLCPVWPKWGRGRALGPRMAAMGAWPIPWAPYGHLVGVVGPLGPVWPLWGRGRSPGPRMTTL